MKTYQKINTMYKRYQHLNKNTCPNKKWLEFSNKIILGDFSNKEAEYLFDVKWEVTSKIDGTNSKIAYYPSSGEIKVGGKSDTADSLHGQFEYLQAIADRIKPILAEMYPKECARFSQVLDDNKKPIYEDVDCNESKKIVTLEEEPIYIYGEYYGNGVQKGGSYIKDGNDFIVFDIRQQGWWIPSAMRHEICEKLGLKEVPSLGMMSLREAEKLVIDGFKTLLPNVSDPSLIEEGVVCRTPINLKASNGERIIVKIKHKDYVAYNKVRSKFTDDEFKEFSDWYNSYQKQMENQ